ncbi:Crp/Fnr family transcriptional regulator [Aurantivibrio plasticivorans]
MQLPEKHLPELDELAKRICSLTKHILEGLPSDGDPIAMSSVQDLFDGQPNTRIFVVKEGLLDYEFGGKVVFRAQPGDLLGFAKSLKLEEGPYSADSPVELIPYTRDQLMAHVNSSETLQKHWTLLLISQASYYRQALAVETPGLYQPATGFLHFEEGDTIIAQGEEAECVYTLLEGSADAIHDEIKVGEIKAEEIFGAMAVFTGQRRNASVVATSACSVLAVRKDEFLDLVAHHPKVAVNLVEEMAEKINQLNRQVRSLQ